MAEILKNLFKVVLGVLFVMAGVWFSFGNSWGQAALTLIKGGVVLLVLLVGFVLVLIGFSDLKNAE